MSFFFFFPLLSQASTNLFMFLDQGGLAKEGTTKKLKCSLIKVCNFSLFTEAGAKMAASLTHL